MYAKSILDQVRARAVAGNWTRHLSLTPLALALGVAILPFTLEPRLVAYTPAPVSAQTKLTAEESQLFAGLVQANVSTAPKRMGLPIDKQQRLITQYITRKFGVSVDVVNDFVKMAFAAGKQHGIDPRLIVAMMAVESSFNPIAESYAGAKGLMQIIPKYHLEKFAQFGGEQTVFDPRVNISVGARIVREYLLLNAGDLFTALQTYAGALADRDSVYTHRVLNEKDHLDSLAGLPKTDRRHRVTMTPEPEQPGKPYMPVVPLTLHPETVAAPAAPGPVIKPGEEPAHTPPTTQMREPQSPESPTATNPPAPAAVNLTLATPQTAVRF